MPGLINTRLELPKFTPPPDTTASLDWAPLTIIDLSRFDAPGGKEKLAKELGDAVKRWGFWVVTSTGISQNQVDRQLDIGNAFFKQPLEEKRKVACDFSVGKWVGVLCSPSLCTYSNMTLSYFGYREPTRFIGRTDVKENMEMVCLARLSSLSLIHLKIAQYPETHLTIWLHSQARFHQSLRWWNRFFPEATLGKCR